MSLRARALNREFIFPIVDVDVIAAITPRQTIQLQSTAFATQATSPPGAAMLRITDRLCFRGCSQRWCDRRRLRRTGKPDRHSEEEAVKHASQKVAYVDPGKICKELARVHPLGLESHREQREVAGNQLTVPTR